jgi:hypothetical protein
MLKAILKSISATSNNSKNIFFLNYVLGIVLTAAHKVADKNLDDLRVRCGVWDIKVKKKRQ